MTNTEHKIQPDAVDATVVDEQQATPDIDAPMTYEYATLAVLLLLLVAGLVGLSPHAKAITNAKSDRAYALLRAPVLVQLPEGSRIQLAPAHRQGTDLKSLAGVVDQAATIRERAASLAAANRNNIVIPPVGSRLTPETYNVMLAYLAEKEGITLEADAIDVLLRAGYTLPEGVLAQQNKNTDHAAFARDVVSALVKDEVESFLSKLNVVSKVGVYVAEQKSAE